MGSLTTCLKKAGDLLDAEDRRAIIAKARELRASGMPSAEASRRALDEQIDNVQAMLDNAPEPTPTVKTPAVPRAETKELTATEAAVLKPSRRERMLGELLSQATDPEIKADLTKQIEADRKARADRARGEEYAKLAEATEDPELRRDLEAKAAKLGVERAIPVPDATEIPVGEVIEVGEAAIDIAIDEADWRAANLLGAQEAERAKALARALRIDPAAAEAAAAQFNNQPRALDRAIDEIIAKKEADDANERQGAAEGGEGLQQPAGRGEGGEEAGGGGDQQGQGAVAGDESSRRARDEDADALQREAQGSDDGQRAEGKSSAGRNAQDDRERQGVADDLAALDRLREGLGEASRTVVVPDSDVHAAFARGVADSFRAPIYFVRNEAGGAGWNAFTNNGRVYINVDGDAPAVALAMHEVGHNLPEDIKADMIAAVMETVTPQQRARFLREFPFYRSKTPAIQDEELVMRVIEQDAQNPAFWDSLAQRLGDTRFGQVARSILNALDRILSGFAKEDSSEFTSDIKRVRKAVADAFAMAEARQQMGQPRDGDARFSERRNQRRFSREKAIAALPEDIRNDPLFGPERPEARDVGAASALWERVHNFGESIGAPWAIGTDSIGNITISGRLTVPQADQLKRFADENQLGIYALRSSGLSTRWLQSLGFTPVQGMGLVAQIGGAEPRGESSTNEILNRAIAVYKPRGISEFMFSERRRPDVSPLGFFSQLARSVESGPGKGSAQAWKDYIRGQQSKGVKADEVEWSGVNEWLDMQQGPITRDALAEFVRGNGVQVQEVRLGGAELDAGALSAKLPDGYDVRVDDISGDPVFTWNNDGDLEFMDYEDLPEHVQRIVDKHTAEGGGQPVKYSRYVVPGGSNYREVLLTLPANERRYAYDAFNPRTQKSQQFKTRAEAEEFANKDESGNTVVSQVEAGKGDYKSSHWDQPNVLAHFRVDDRTDADGKRVLFVNEIQSDWGQQGKKKGFSEDALAARADRKDGYWEVSDANGTFIANVFGDKTEQQAIDEANERIRERPRSTAVGERVPRAPFVGKTDAWVSLALKRIIKMASDEGYDRVAFINGQQAADLYDLSKQVRSIEWVGDKSDWRAVTITPTSGNDIEFRVKPDGTTTGFGHDDTGNGFGGKRLDEVVGKDVADKIMAERDGSLSGNGLKVGGEGMRAFYDKIVPAVAKDVLKKVGGSVGKTSIGGSREGRDDYSIKERQTGGFVARIGDQAANFSKWEDANEWLNQRLGFEATSIDITPAMREKVAGGLPLFSERRKREVTETPEFKRWFGDSKVVDADGKPLVVYRGDKIGKTSFTKENGKSRVQGNVFFTNDPATARGYTPGGWRENKLKNATELYEADGVYRVYLSLQNPLVIPDVEMAEWSRIPVPVSLQRKAQAKIMQIDDLAFFASKAGYDGLIVRNVADQFGFGDQYVAFRPEQIKSATGNRGTFDPADTDIRMSERRRPDAGGIDMGAGYKSAKIGDATVEYINSPDGKRMEIVMVKVPPEVRDRGSARRALESLLAEADRGGMQVALTVEPMDRSTSKSKLERFYASLGFLPNKGRNKDFTTMAGMIRAPRPATPDSTATQQPAAKMPPREFRRLLVPRDQQRSRSPQE